MIVKINQKNNTYFKNNLASNNKKDKRKCEPTLLQLGHLPLINMIGYLPNMVQSPTDKIKNIEELNIPNLHIINGNSVRGESLSHKRNKPYIKSMAEYGIERVIDLKTSDHSDSFQYLVESNGLEYYHFPIDSDKKDVREIIDCLPKLFETINKGNFYIACAQGLHRTDIALTINYLFNTKANEEPPILYGHVSKNGVRYEDIFKRTNNIFKSLTEEDRKILGLVDFDEEAYKAKKSMLMKANNKYSEECL